MATSPEYSILYDPNDWLAGDGEMGKLISSMDWAKTPLGPICTWPRDLRVRVSICLASRFYGSGASRPSFKWRARSLDKLIHSARDQQVVTPERKTVPSEDVLRIEAQTAREYLEKVVAGINDQFLILDRQWHFIYVNDRVLETTGLEREQLLNRSIWEVFPEVLGTDFERKMRRAVEAGDQDHFEYYHQIKDRWFEHHVYPSAEGMMLLIMEITERKRAEAEREQLLAREQAARRQAEQANHLKDEFLATVSHELRTPLNHMLGWAMLLRDGKLSAAQERTAIEIIERNVRIQSRLIEDLLDSSRVITGRLSLDLRRIDVMSVVKAAVAAVQPAADDKNIELRITELGGRIDQSPAEVMGDFDRLQQVVLNLLSNAIKFTPPDGDVEVRLRRMATQIEIDIIDKGEGIEPEFLPFVFDWFRQADGSAKRKYGGLGLGLAIVRHLVELHEGKVRAESVGPGQGATFTITLPLAAAWMGYNGLRTTQAGVDFETNLTIAPRLDGLRVLVVDDEPDLLYAVRSLLASHGAEVQAAEGRDAALTAFIEWQPDVLIADIAAEDGYELVRQLRQREHGGKRLHAIALTADARAEDRLRALAAGYHVNVSKPVQPAELLTVVASISGKLGRETT